MDGILPWHRRRQAPVPVEPEDQTVRQYRFLLQTAHPDALEAAHGDALTAISAAERLAVLRTVQDELVVGMHLGAHDVARLAHLVTWGERRRPGVLVTSLPRSVCRALAEAVIHSEPAFALFGG